MLSWLKWIVVAVLALVALSVLAGRAGWLQGRAPADLGLRDGRLKPPSKRPNSVSSQARLWPDHPRHREAQIEPLRYSGNPAAAMARLARVVEAMPGAQIQRRDGAYLYATYTTPLMHYVDDVEFALDPAAGVIDVRSASRLGHSDRGLNRARVEDIRARFAAAAQP
jgi:uncharacterized protein (DUF1499 family)